MSNNLIRDAAIISALFAGSIFAYVNRDTLYEYAGINPQDIADARQHARSTSQPVKYKQAGNRQQTSNTSLTGYSTVIAKSPDGQYWAEALVNHKKVRFLVDTGASIVVLTPHDAQKAGLRPDDLIYNVAMNTAAGQIMAARVDIASISVENVTVHNVRGVVIPTGLTHSLLGMSYLGELRKLEVTPEELVLRQ